MSLCVGIQHILNHIEKVEGFIRIHLEFLSITDERKNSLLTTCLTKWNPLTLLIFTSRKVGSLGSETHPLCWNPKPFLNLSIQLLKAFSYYMICSLNFATCTQSPAQSGSTLTFLLTLY